MKIIYNIIFSRKDAINIGFWAFLMVFVLPLATFMPAQAQVDVWMLQNKGFGKCANIGQRSSEASWFRDNFQVSRLLHRRGLMYAYVSYKDGGTTPSTDLDGVTPHPDFNNTACGAGLFRLDTIRDEWEKVAGSVGAQAGVFITNGVDIFNLYDGNVYQYTEDYTAYPNGWKNAAQPGHQNIKYKDHVFKNQPGAWPNNDLVKFGEGNGAENAPNNALPIAGIGDTIYYIINARVDDLDANGEADWTVYNKVGKFAISSGRWYFENVGRLPDQKLDTGINNTDGVAYRGLGTDNPNRQVVFTKRIGGLFKYFVRLSSNPYSQSYIPRFIWAYDPRIGDWVNISLGPDWNNTTNNSCSSIRELCYRCAQGLAPADSCNDEVVLDAAWAVGDLLPSWDRRRLYVGSETGIWEWRGDSWVFVASETVGPGHLATSNGIFTFGRNSRGPVYQVVGARFNITNDRDINDRLVFDPGCTQEANRYLSTPDNGRTIFFHKTDTKGENCAGTGNITYGIYKLIPDPDKPSSIRNLHVKTATYLGNATSDNEPVNVGVGGKLHLFNAGNYSGANGVQHPTDYYTFSASWPLGAGNAKIIITNYSADTLMGVATVGNKMDDYEIQNFGEYRMVTAGDFGVAVLDSMAQSVIWHKNYASLGFAHSYGKLAVDIDDDGDVVVMNSLGSSTEFRVFDPTGVPLAPARTLWVPDIGQPDYAEDVTIKNKQVFLTGYNNGTLSAPAMATCRGEYNGRPVQSAWILSYTLGAGTYNYNWKTWGIPGYELDLDEADTRGYVINVGKDGKVYFVGEAAGGNSVFRWNGRNSIQNNGCTNPSSTLIMTDDYNTPNNTKSAHITYFATIDPNTGLVERGQYIIPRTSSGLSNTYRSNESYIHADQQGYVYLGGYSAYQIAGRDLVNINGTLVGDYVGKDMNVMIVSPDYQQRIFWGVFSDSAGIGNITGVGIRDNVIGICGYTEAGTMITTNNALNTSPFHLEYTDSNPNNDSYLAVWYQDVWNQADNDTLEEKTFVSDTIISSIQYFQKPDFLASVTTQCINKPITYTNTSQGDSTAHTWNFGSSGSLGAGVTGQGPYTITYSTPGLKNVRLDVVMKGNFADFEEKYGYVNILPNNTELDPIIGPDSLCAGGIVYFEVEPVFGVSSYNWSVPSDATILRGQGSNIVRVAWGGNSGNISVSGTYPCGTTPLISKHVRVNGLQPNNVLVVVGQTSPLSAADQSLLAKIQTLGYTTTVQLDSLIEGTNAECMGAVVVSESVNAELLGFKLLDLRTPVIVLDAASLTKLGMTNGSFLNDYGTQGFQNQITLTAGSVNNQMGQYSDGTAIGVGDQTVYSGFGTLQWGRPASTATVIATVKGQPNYATIFGYEIGTTMPGQVAPERRVGFFMGQGGVSLTTALADTLFKRAICWAKRSCPTSLSIATATSLPTGPLCPGDSIYIPYTKVGTFNGSVPVVANINVDNDAGLPQVAYSSNWVVRTSGDGRFPAMGTPNYQGASYIQIRTDANQPATYTPNIPHEGVYKVEVHVPNPDYTSPGIDYCPVVPVRIAHKTGTSVVYINQQNNLNAWLDVGNYTFVSGSVGNIQIQTSSCSDTAFILADQIRLTAIDIFPVGNEFTAQLSNAFGNFNASQTLGYIKSVDNGTIAGKIPETLGGGNGYRIRVVSNDPAVVGSNNGSNITISGLPNKLGPISGPSTICRGTGSDFEYCVSSINNSDSLIWELPLGTNVVGYPGQVRVTTPASDSCISVRFTTATNGTIKVRGKNTCGEAVSTNASTFTFNITGEPPVAPANITGPATVCQTRTEYYTAAMVSGATHYNWILPTGVSMPAPDSAAAVQLNFSFVPNPSTVEIGVTAVNQCGNSDTTYFSVLVDNNASLPLLTGSVTETGPDACGYLNYRIAPLASPATYNWTLPTGARIVTGSGTNSIDVQFTQTVSAQTVAVTATDACGTSAPEGISVTQSQNPITVYVHLKDQTPLHPSDQRLLDSLANWGYQTGNNVNGDDPGCADLLILTGMADNGDNYNIYKHLDVPIMAMKNSSQFVALAMAPLAGSGVVNSESIYIADNNHQITNDFDLGELQVVSGGGSLDDITYASPTSSAQVLSSTTTNPAQATIFAYEKGDPMVGGFLAPQKRLGMFYALDGYNSATNAGYKLMRYAVCWLMGNYANCNSTIMFNTNQLATTQYCQGNTIPISFTSNQNFNAGNEFRVEMSDNTGSFASPTVIGSKASTNAPETIDAVLPTVSGAGYKLRVASTNPPLDALPAANPDTTGGYLNLNGGNTLITGYNGVTGTGSRAIGFAFRTAPGETGMRDVIWWGGNSGLDYFTIQMELSANAVILTLDWDGGTRSQYYNYVPTSYVQLNDGNWHYVHLFINNTSSIGNSRVVLDGSLINNGAGSCSGWVPTNGLGCVEGNRSIIGSNTAVNTGSANVITLGNNPDVVGSGFTGDLDDIRIWSGLVNGADHAPYASRGANLVGHPNLGLLAARYQFSALPVSQGVDESGNARTMAIGSPDIQEFEIGRLDQELTITGANEWTGALSADWFDPGNWTCQVPSLTVSGVIPASGVTNEPEISGANAACRNLTIEAGRTLTISNGQQLSLAGNLNVDASASIVQAGAQINAVGNTPQTFSGLTSAFNLMLNNGAELIITQDLLVTNQLMLQSGLLTVGPHTLTLDNGATISGYGNNSFVQTENNPAGTGNLTQFVPATGGVVVFPVGVNGVYSPALLRAPVSGVNSDVSVRVFAGVYQHGYSGAVQTDSVVNRTWDVNPTAGGFRADLSLQWPLTTELPQFARITSFIMHHSGTIGQPWSAVSPTGNATGIGPYTTTATSITNFSPFTVGSEEVVPLPLSVLSFSGYLQSNQAVLYWNTINTKNVMAYELQKSLDNQNYTPISRHTPIQNNQAQTFEHIDEYFENHAYYRLKVVDVNRLVEYSQVLFLSANQAANLSYSVVPNPASRFVSLVQKGVSDQHHIPHLRFMDLAGKVIINKHGSLAELNQSINQKLPALKQGLYFITITNQNGQQQLKLIVQ